LVDVNEVVEFKKQLEEKDPTPESIVLILERLQDVHVDRDLLSRTKIGVTVGRLQKRKEEDIRKLSSFLVTKWKAAISKQRSSSNNDTDTKVKSSTILSGDSQSNISENDYPGEVTGDDRRDKTRRLLWVALCNGATLDDVVRMDMNATGKTAGEIESAVYAHFCGNRNNEKGYWGQIRTIRANLNDKANPEFNNRILTGELKASELVAMTSLSMASDAKKAERERHWNECKEACQSDWELRNVKRSAGQFPCGKCKSLDTAYFQMQTRSADEPMTTFVTCRNCGNRWKF